MTITEREVASDALRRELRRLLTEIEHQGVHVTVLRYDTAAAVLVPVSWYQQARQALERNES